MLLALGAGGGLALASSNGKRSACAGDSSRALTRNFVADAAERALPAVVNITAGIGGGSFFAASGLSAGSGFIIRPDGLVVTNAHVVEGASNGAIVCTLNDGRKFTGRVKSLDRGSDIALVQIEEAPDLPVAMIGSSSTLRVGEWVVALGSPLTLQNSCTAGIVSALARHGSEIGMAHGRTDYIQTDAAINVGNSGGPLVNLDGAVVGISTLKAQGTDGIGFAIPIDTAWLVVKSLLEHGRVIRPYVGIKMVTVDTSRSRQRRRGHPTAKDDLAVMIVEVAPASPAAKAGLLLGDIILEFDGKPASSPSQVIERVGLEHGNAIAIKVKRHDTGEELSFTLKTEPENRRARL